VGVHRRQEAPRLGRVPEPFALLGNEDVRVIETDRRAVDAAELLDCLERVGRRPGDRTVDERCRKLPQILVGDCMRRWRE